MTVPVLRILVLILAAFSVVISQPPATANSRMAKALALYQKKDFDAALKLLDEEIRDNPRNNYAFLIRGEIYLFKRNLEPALSDTEMVIKLAPKAIGIEKAYSNRGVIYQFYGKDDQALEDFDKAISINPRYASPYNGRGVILDKRGRADEAVAAFDKAIELDPLGGAAYVGRAEIRFQRAQFDLALADLNKFLSLYPSDPPNLIRRGYIYGLMGRWELAVADIRMGYFIFLNPSTKYQGIIDVTFRDLDRFIARYPESANARAVRGFVNLLLKKDEEANIDFDRACALDSKLKNELESLIESVKLRRE
jgi:tetratricopeptide (TPR) repeat protein